MTAKAVMVLGTTSGAGKSWLATALCRWYARQGLRVAPFKAQNMSNNARVVPGPDGRFGEIGSAQYFQALAAGVPAEVRMNPVLLKPERDTASQVVVWGEVRPDLYRVPWRERSALLWPHAQSALQALIEENDVVVIEGAGSPAEINLQASDYVNLRTAAAARASCLLVNDASSGGAAAHLYGTQQLLPGDVRALLRGFVLNRCSGDLTRFMPDAARLQALTGVPTLAMLPMWHGHGLPEEDGVFDAARGTAGAGLRIAVVAYPRISNLDEFQPLKNLPGVQLCWARSPGDLHGADWIMLPGSKHTSSDLAWLRAQRLDRAVAAHAARGGAVLGICGGLQMLGAALMDPHGIDGNAPGLGLLALSTTYQQHKAVRHQQVKFDTFNPSSGPWNALSGVTLRGYEIHHGETIADTASASGDHVTPVIGDGLGWRIGGGNVLGIYLHGLFEEPAVLHALFGAAVPTLDTVFDGLADCIDRHFAPGALRRLLK